MLPVLAVFLEVLDEFGGGVLGGGDGVEEAVAEAGGAAEGFALGGADPDGDAGLLDGLGGAADVIRTLLKVKWSPWKENSSSSQHLIMIWMASSVMGPRKRRSMLKVVNSG